MNYELMLVVNPTVDIEPVISRVEKSVKDTGAASIKINKLGKKPLSYQIAKQNEGEYILVNFEAPGEAVGAIAKSLRLEQEAILRYLIIKAKASGVSKISETLDTGGEKEPPKVTVKTVSSKDKKEKAPKVKTKETKQRIVKKQKVTKKGKK